MSWRVALLPYIDRAELRSQYRDDLAWDDSANLEFARTSVKSLVCPSAPVGAGRLSKAEVHQLCLDDRDEYRMSRWSNAGLDQAQFIEPNGNCDRSVRQEHRVDRAARCGCLGEHNQPQPARANSQRIAVARIEPSPERRQRTHGRWKCPLSPTKHRSQSVEGSHDG